MKMFFEKMADGSTPRKSRRCLAAAVAWLYKTELRGGKDKSSKIPVCRQCLAAQRQNL